MKETTVFFPWDRFSPGALLNKRTFRKRILRDVAKPRRKKCGKQRDHESSLIFTNRYGRSSSPISEDQRRLVVQKDLAARSTQNVTVFTLLLADVVNVDLSVEPTEDQVPPVSNPHVLLFEALPT